MSPQTGASPCDAAPADSRELTVAERAKRLLPHFAADAFSTTDREANADANSLGWEQWDQWNQFHNQI